MNEYNNTIERYFRVFNILTEAFHENKLVVFNNDYLLIRNKLWFKQKSTDLS